MTLADTLRAMPTATLEKLDALFQHMDAGAANCSNDELLGRIASNTPPPSKPGNDLIGARIYELEIYKHLDPATARAQALEEFAAGKLKDAGIKSAIAVKRYKPKTELVSKPVVPTPSPPPINAPVGALGPRETPPEPLPDNVTVLPTRLTLGNFYGKLFHGGSTGSGGNTDNDIW
jgi:hypothetical protein